MYARLTRVEGSPYCVGGAFITPETIGVHNPPLIISPDKAQGVSSGFFGQVFDRDSHAKLCASVCEGKDRGVTVNSIVAV